MVKKFIFLMKYRVLLPVLLSAGIVFQSCAHDHTGKKTTGTEPAPVTSKPKAELRIDAPAGQSVIIPGTAF